MDFPGSIHVAVESCDLERRGVVNGTAPDRDWADRSFACVSLDSRTATLRCRIDWSLYSCMLQIDVQA